MQPALLHHPWDRVDQRGILVPQLRLFATWLETEPEVPHGKWFKRFPEMTVCGERWLIKTFLRIGPIEDGEKVV